MIKQFTDSQFTPTQWDSAADKARFANHFVRFARNGFQRASFPKWFYRRLSMCFGHIAHFNIDGFYYEWFCDNERKALFLLNVLRAGGYGSPEYTYSDVERALASWVRDSRILDDYQQRAVNDQDARDRAEYARLQQKYGGK